MKVQIAENFAGTITHVIWSFVFVNYFDYGVIGTGFAGVLTNLLILVGNKATYGRHKIRNG